MHVPRPPRLDLDSTFQKQPEQAMGGSCCPHYVKTTGHSGDLAVISVTALPLTCANEVTLSFLDSMESQASGLTEYTGHMTCWF